MKRVLKAAKIVYIVISVIVLLVAFTSIYVSDAFPGFAPLWDTFPIPEIFGGVVLFMGYTSLYLMIDL